MKLIDDNNVKIMFVIFDQYSIKGLIELDDSFVRSVEQIQKSFICLRNYEETRALLDALDEDISLANP